MHIALVAAMANNRVIGKDGDMPWHLPGELQYFKEITMNKPIIMGRKTFESIGRPLPGRTNIVLTRNPQGLPESVKVADSPDKALAIAEQSGHNTDEAMVIGGGQIYELFMPVASRMYLTHIDLDVEGDTWFPQWSESHWTRTELRHVPKSEGNPQSFTGYRYDLQQR